MPDAPVLCARCAKPVQVDADGGVVCEHCLVRWDSVEAMSRNSPRQKEGPAASVEAKRLLAKETRTDANARIRELMTELDPLSADQFAVQRAELMRRYALSKSEINGFYHRAHAPKPATQESKPQPQAPPDALPFRILGTADDGLTYFIDRSERLYTLRLGGLTKTQLFLLADRDWWEDAFPGARGRMDLDGAINYL